VITELNQKITVVFVYLLLEKQMTIQYKSHQPRITSQQLISITKNTLSQEWDKHICDMIVLMPELLQSIIDIALEDENFNYQRDIKSSTAIIIRSLATMICRLNQSLEQEEITNG
jgi:hypothetical protein